MPEIRQIRVGGVTYDLVISEDEISATRARASEMSARTYSISAQSSKDSAAQSATASLQNYYNAIQEADRAEDAADRAEAIVGGQFVSYGQDQGLSDTYKAQARKNIDAEPFFIKITTSGISDDTHVVDKTSEEIVHAYEAGRTLVVIWERTFFNEIHTLYLSHKGISYGSGERGIGLDFTNPMSMNSAGLMTSYVWSFESLSNIWGLTKKFGIPLLYDPTTEEFPIEDAETFRAAISAGASNMNLLDNPFFTIHQKGTGGVTGVGYAVDRWKNTGGANLTQTPRSPYGITFASSSGYQVDQALWAYPAEYLDGKTLTLSVMTNGGKVAQATGTFTATSSTAAKVAVTSADGNFTVGLYYIPSARAVPFVRITTPSGKFPVNAAILAVKLEKGSYSTLANDVPPEYGEELLKCQRYFYRMDGSAANYTSYGFCVAVTATKAELFVNTPVVMRATPTVSYSGTFQLRDYAGGNTRAISEMGVDTRAATTLKVAITTSSLTTGWIMQLRGAASATYIDFFADI